MKANKHLFFSNFKVSPEEKVSNGFFSVYIWMVLRRFFFACSIALSHFFQKQWKFVIQDILQPTITNIVFFINFKKLYLLLNSQKFLPFGLTFSRNTFKIKQYGSSQRISFLFHLCNGLCFTFKSTYTLIVSSKEIVILYKNDLVFLI